MAVAQESYILSYHDIKLPEKEEEQALLSIGETESNRNICLKMLIQRLKEQDEFSPCLEESFLLRFLRNSKFDCDKAFSRIKKFYSIQKSFPDYFEHCSQSALQKAHLLSMHASPYRLKDHSMLGINKFFLHNPPEIPVKEKFYLYIVVFDALLENPLNQMCGETFICDFKGITAFNLFHYNPKIAWLYMDSLQGASPSRFKNIHVVNLSRIGRILLNIGYRFLSKKLKDRIHIHSDYVHWTDLHSFIPPKLLPEEYGGHLKQPDLINLADNIYEKEDLFRKYSPKSQTK